MSGVSDWRLELAGLFFTFAKILLDFSKPRNWLYVDIWPDWQPLRCQQKLFRAFICFSSLRFPAASLHLTWPYILELIKVHNIPGLLEHFIKQSDCQNLTGFSSILSAIGQQEAQQKAQYVVL